MSLLIEMYFREQYLSSATAFVCLGQSGPLLITNRHNFTGRNQETQQPISPTGGIPDRIRIRHNSIMGLGHFLWIEQMLLSDEGLPLWCEHPTLRDRADFVGLRLERVNDYLMMPHLQSVSPGLMLSVTDVVSVIGYPFKVSAQGTAIWASGFIASEPGISFNDLPTLLIDCRSRPGQSGSPVVAFRAAGAVPLANGNTSIFTGPIWEFLGIYSGRIRGDSDLGVVWKAQALQELLLAN
jgi:hypothetical protein